MAQVAGRGVRVAATKGGGQGLEGSGGHVEQQLAQVRAAFHAAQVLLDGLAPAARHAAAHHALQRGLGLGLSFVLPVVLVGLNFAGLVRGYHCEDAETIVVALGSVIGTLRDTVEELREAGMKIGVLGIQSYRPFPLAAVREALQGAQRVVVLEKSFSVGLGGVVSTDVRLALSGLSLRGCTVVAGLGGRAITRASLARMLLEALADKLPPLSFLDLDWRIVNRQLEREAQMRRSGPTAENLLRDVGTVASKVN